MGTTRKPLHEQVNSLSQLQNTLSLYTPPKNTNVTKKASVLIPLFEKENTPHILLTKRSSHLRSHSGQVSFPGGKQDDQDKDALQTALRESYEEIGLDPKVVNVIGCIDQIISRNLYLVTPFVAVIPAHFQLNINTDEIESVFSVPLDFFMKQENHFTDEIFTTRFPFLLHHFIYKEYDIWGLTAMLILRLLEIGFNYVPEYPLHHPESPTWMALAQNFTNETAL